MHVYMHMHVHVHVRVLMFVESWDVIVMKLGMSEECIVVLL